jgi:hypothetical protein
VASLAAAYGSGSAAAVLDCGRCDRRDRSLPVENAASLAAVYGSDFAVAVEAVRRACGLRAEIVEGAEILELIATTADGDVGGFLYFLR